MNDRINIPIDAERIAEICRRWKITELSLFGSVLRDDFRPDSDVDVLISFVPHHGWSLLDVVDLKADLKVVFGREVDVAFRSGLNNPFRRRAIMESRRVLYAA